jgi:hypothetical protein
LHKEIAGNCAIVASVGRGIVLNDYALEAAAELEAAGWLERRTEANGDTSWHWSPRAELALELSALSDVSGREN